MSPSEQSTSRSKCFRLAGFLFVIALGFSMSARATGLCIPPTVEKSDPYHFLLGVSDALTHAKEGLSRLDDLDPQAGAYGLLVALKLQKSDYICSESQVSPYAASSDTLISNPARHLSFIFKRLEALNDELAEQAKELLDPRPSTSAAEMAERQAQVQSDLEQMWGILAPAVIMATYAVIRVDPATGKMSRLALTAAQRERLLGNLRAAFGKSVSGGIKEGQHPVEAAAAALYQVVGNPGYRLKAR